MIQTLKGIKISPKGAKNRFASQNWGQSYAFGGWIYNASAEIGYSNKPTEIKISVVLNTSSFSQSAAGFDINEKDLHCDAEEGGRDKEYLYDIDFDGYVFSDFILYSYDTSIDVGQKILNVTFKDYSIILDKIYVGLFKKQGYEFPKISRCKMELPIRCQDCQYSGSSFIGTGSADRDIEFCSYAGINGVLYDNFSDIYYSTKENPYDHWSKLIGRTSKNGEFDLNGGFLILGTESATEERCDSAPAITYSFIELLGSLSMNGLKITGDFPSDGPSSDLIYRTNHIGSLREVLQNWCSDLGYDFYFSGRCLVGINLKRPIDLDDISNIGDPNSSLGSELQINNGGDSAILSLNSSVSLDNTFKQSVIVENSYPNIQKDVSKSVKKYVGITPLHPISLNEMNRNVINDTNLYGIPFTRRAFEVFDFEDDWGIQFTRNFSRLDGRSYYDVDVAIALSHYNSTIRDLFVAQRCLRNAKIVPTIKKDNTFGGFQVDPDYDGYRANSWLSIGSFHALESNYCLANFKALGMDPLVEIYNEEMKADILTEYFQNGEKDGLSNLCMDQKYFKIFLGYYNPDLKADIVEWEKNAATAMYKYGVVTKGTTATEPFVPVDILNDISPTKGFVTEKEPYGATALVHERIKNSFDPQTARYYSLKDAPFANVMIDSGYVKALRSPGVYYENNSKYPPFIPQGFADYPGRIPTGLWISTLDNDWGTSQAEFDRALSFSFGDACADQYSMEQNAAQILTDSDKNYQDWKMEYFLPIADPNLQKIEDIIMSDIYDFDGAVDNIVTTYTDHRLNQTQSCKKLHVLIIPDTQFHPNLQLGFWTNNNNAINKTVLNNYKQKLYQADLNKNTTQTPSICSISLLEEMCRNILSGGDEYKFKTDPPLTVEQTGCVILEDKNNYLLEGFPSSLLYRPNSRTLDITIRKNPNNNLDIQPLDINGDFYYADLEDGFLEVSSNTDTIRIVYPINSPNSLANYSGIMETSVEIQSRIPAFTQIFGMPNHGQKNNTSSIKVINNTVDNTLNPQLDPITNKVMSYITVIDGGGDTNILKTPEEYYKKVSSLNNYNLDTPMKTINLTIAGAPRNFGPNLYNRLDPKFGLNQMSINVSDNGVKTSLSFSDRPKVLAKQETILNKIGARLKNS